MVSSWSTSKYRVQDPNSKYGFFGSFLELEQTRSFGVGFANVEIDIIVVVDINENISENVIISEFLTTS